MNKRRIYVIVAVLLAALSGVGVACRKSDFSAQGYRYGRYGPIHVLGKLWVDSDANLDGALDVDGTTNLDVVDIDGAVDFGGQELDLDADNDTSITADTDDQIDIEISGADDFQFTANTFTLRAGSKMVAENATQAGPVFSASASHTHAVSETEVTMFVIPANANVVDVIYTVDTQWNDGSSAAVDCGISGGDVDAFVDNMNINDAADFNRLGDASDMPYATSLIDVGAANATVICQVAEGANDASAGAATLYITYVID